MITAADILMGKVKPGDLTSKDLASMPHDALWLMRDRYRDPETQRRVAPYEHQAFAREAVRENAFMAAPILVATPLYAAAKALGIAPKGDGPQTSASLEQITRSFVGIAQGLGIR